MKKLVATFVILTIFLVAWMGWLRIHDISEVVTDGPFDRRFGKRLYDHTPGEIEYWFAQKIPLEANRKQVRQILNSSFSADLTTGRKVLIHRDSGMAGGESTEVVLYIENDHFQKAFVEMHQVYY